MIDMKKILAFCLTLVMLFVLGVTAFAAPGNFVQSPSRNEGPELIEGENESEDCTAKLVVTPYKERDTLPAKALADIEKVYKIIASGTDLTSLNTAFSAYVAGKGLREANLAVSDLFDVSYYNCDIHDSHGAFRIKLSADTLNRFVGLLHYNDGVWEFVENAHVLSDGETLEFTVKDFSPFAVVVEKEAGSVNLPDTGDVSFVLPIIMFVCSIALIVVCVSIKKKTV